ncbi:unnamed protein product [Spirodela intermedia]|uniref:Uncharacterized protein n=1 Tax=Spirodela intermedia TaxID=51605 RepID=A0A7I8LH77_SPIIN|nr:unnamed protein product [Spirodela intermedia]
MKQAAQVLHWCERRNWEATNLRSSATRAKASTSVRAFTVLVEEGRLEDELGSRAQVRSSSPQKSPPLRKSALKKPVLPPLVVALSSVPRMMNSISSTGSPSRTMMLDPVYRTGFSLSHIASISWSHAVNSVESESKEKLLVFLRILPAVQRPHAVVAISTAQTY